MFVTFRNTLFGLLAASLFCAALCAVFLLASFTGVSMPHGAWATGWLPVQVSNESPGTFRRKVTRFSSLERAVAKAGPGDTVKILASIDISEPVSVDKDLSIVIGRGCDVRNAVGEGRSVLTIGPACHRFALLAEPASRFVFSSADPGCLLAVSAASPNVEIAIRGISVHDASPKDGAALIDLGARPAELHLEGSDVFNLAAPVIKARTGTRASIAVAHSRFERIKGDTVIDLSDSPSSSLLVHDSVLIGSLGCDLVHMARPNLLLCGNSYLSALDARTVVNGECVSLPVGGASAIPVCGVA